MSDSFSIDGGVLCTLAVRDSINLRHAESELPPSMRGRLVLPVYKAYEFYRELIKAFWDVVRRFQLIDILDGSSITAHKAVLLEYVILMQRPIHGLAQQRSGHLRSQKFRGSTIL